MRRLLVRTTFAVLLVVGAIAPMQLEARGCICDTGQICCGDCDTNCHNGACTASCGACCPV